ncbi:unnamed protein product [Timema podura]|uniref:Uncharacterized protein n=1 Tax=Timema podura TaxID=61482 RepID=A0ABN7P104_TIMPD|nr:unnamed protein product [Timema podura]
MIQAEKKATSRSLEALKIKKNEADQKHHEGEDMHPFKEAILDLLMVWKIQNPWMVILKEWMDIHPQGLILVNKVHVIRLLVIFSKGEKNNCPLHQLVVCEDRYR